MSSFMPRLSSYETICSTSMNPLYLLILIQFEIIIVIFDTFRFSNNLPLRFKYSGYSTESIDTALIKGVSAFNSDVSFACIYATLIYSFFAQVNGVKTVSVFSTLVIRAMRRHKLSSD